MDADAAAAPCRKPASHSLPQPPLLFAVRARSGRVADLGAGGAAFSGPPDTPPRPSLVTVPFLWEEAPGMPKASPTACAAATTPNAANAGPVPEGETGDRQDQAARPLPLKLPPRLQQVPASFTAADTRQGSGHADQARPLPPLKLPPRLQQVSASFAAADTVLQGPYYARAGGGRRTPRWARSGGAALRRTTSAGVALFSRTWSKRRAAAPAAGRNKNRCDIHERDAAGPDAPWYSPSSPSSSSSSVSTCFGGDDHGRGRPADGREVASEEDDGSPRGSVRITRFRLRRNRSLPSMSTSNLWDMQTKNMITRCNSSNDLYQFFLPSTSTATLVAAPSSLWHQRRLRHLGWEALSKLISSNVIPCNKDDPEHLCHACQLGRNVRLPYTSSSSRAPNKFDLIHCDL